MDSIKRSKSPEVRKALHELRRRTASNLLAFNEAVPYASWLRRSEIESFTSELLRAAQRAPERLTIKPLRDALGFLSCMKRAVTRTRPPAAPAAAGRSDAL